MEIKQLSYYINQSKIIKPENYQKKIRIAFVGSFTLNGFEETIQVQCNDEKINCKHTIHHIINLIKKF